MFRETTATLKIPIKNKSNPFFLNIIKIFPFHNLSVNPKARLYLQYKTEPRYEPYLDTITNRKIRVQYTKFRLSDRDLEIEKGRHMKVERGNKYCKLCTTGGIGDELHLLFDYNKLYKSRPSFLKYMCKKFSHTKQLDDTGKFIFLSKNENKTMIKKIQ